MADKTPEMIDLVFDLNGGILPADYPFSLWAALIHHVPELAQEGLVGVLPLRATENKAGLLLAKRAKLALRLPKTLAGSAAARLSGNAMQLGTFSLSLGQCTSRAIQPYPTIHAQQVASTRDEVMFMDETKAQLSEMGIAAKLICGKPRVILGGQQPINCYSLVLHDLKPEASVELQYVGLGGNRKFGCGIFIPYKVISGLSDD